MASQVVMRRQFLEAAQSLAKASNPSSDHFIAVCTTLGDLLSDLTGEKVIIVPERCSGTTAEAST